MTDDGQSDIDRIRDATDLLRLVGEHVALSPSGREHVGLCPFHDDKRPSLRVVTHKDHAFYKCFACGASGDCFRFVMEFQRVDFPEALRYLADRAGITLTPRSRTRAGGASSSGSGDGSSTGIRRSELYETVRAGEAFFRKVLNDPVAGAVARRVIEERGIAPEMVEAFGIGAAPIGSGTLLQRLDGDPGAARRAVAAGLIRERDDRRYDTLRNRLVFPIRDEMGRPIAFGGRILDPDDKPKYLNTPETPLFHKSKTLYGLDLARRAIIDQGVVIVTEGYTDVISCHQAGVTNVVGTLGTALTAQHASVLCRLCSTVVLVFDGDEAGQKAADRGVEVFFAQPVDVRICPLPDGLDPDSLMKSPGGPERFRDLIAGAVDALEYKLMRFQAGLERAGGLSGRQRHLEGFLRDLAELGFGAMQGVRKRLVLTRLADLLGLSIADVEAAMPRRRRQVSPASGPGVGRAQTPPPPAAHDMHDMHDVHGLHDMHLSEIEVSRARRIAERELLGIILVEPDLAGATTPDAPHEPAVVDRFDADQFLDPAARAVARVALTAPRTLQQVLAELPEDAHRAFATEIFLDARRARDATCLEFTDDQDPSAMVLRAAANAFAACIEREQFTTHASHAARTGAGAGAAPDGAALDSVLEHIRKRNEQGDLPSAISQGSR